MGQWSEPFRVEEAGRWDRSHVFNARRRQLLTQKIGGGRKWKYSSTGSRQARGLGGHFFLP
jgi:hypothetical protein